MSEHETAHGNSAQMEWQEFWHIFTFAQTGWQPPVIVEADNQKPLPIHNYGTPDAPASCTWNLTITCNSQNLEV
jgi:hypothetical protein